MKKFISYNQYKKSGILNETYESYRELEAIAQSIIEKYKKNSLFGKKKYKRAHLYSISDFVETETSVITDFINNWKVGINYMVKTNKDVAKAMYVPNISFDAFAHLTPEQLKNLKDKYNGIIIIHYLEVSSVLHELQHAYDDYRSNGKMRDKKLLSLGKLNIPSFQKRFVEDNKMLKQQVENMAKQINRYYSKYSNVPAEISSFFVQTLNDIDFFIDKKGIELKNIHTVWDEFKHKYQSYAFLTPKIKKDLARKFSQYYYKVKEEYDKIIQEFSKNKK